MRVATGWVFNGPPPDRPPDFEAVGRPRLAEQPAQLGIPANCTIQLSTLVDNDEFHVYVVEERVRVWRPR